MKIKPNIICLGLLLSSFLTLSANNNLLNNKNELIETVIYPNPVTSGLFSINSNKNIEKVEILNIVGQTIITQSLEASNHVQLDVKKLNTGIYLIKISFSDNTNSIQRIRVK